APGAVHRWDDIADVAGHLVLFVPTAPVTHATRELAASPDPVVRWDIPDADRPYVDAARDHLLLEASAPPPDVSTELPEILLSALLARLRPPHAAARPAHPVFQPFRASV
ncbi:AraC family transcriptional regulator, partial [Streptomyces sp. SID11233]|nr:AraC family transcriptional regulator [Streptomyces sp. SID11233]